MAQLLLKGLQKGVCTSGDINVLTFTDPSPHIACSASTGRLARPRSEKVRKNVLLPLSLQRDELTHRLQVLVAEVGSAPLEVLRTVLS